MVSTIRFHLESLVHSAISTNTVTSLHIIYTLLDSHVPNSSQISFAAFIMTAGEERDPQKAELAMRQSNRISSTSKRPHGTAPKRQKGWRQFTHDLPAMCRNALKQYFQLALGTHAGSTPDFAIDPPTWTTEMTWTEFCYLPLRFAFHRSALRCKWTYKMVIRCAGGIDPRVFKPCSASLACACCKHYVACKNNEYDGLVEIPEELMHNYMEEPLTKEVLRERGHLLGG